MLTAVLVVFLVFFVIWLIKSTRKPLKFPPGPPRLPFVGSVPYLKGHNGINLFDGIRTFAHKYGPVVGFFLGSNPCVLLTGFEDIKETLKQDALASRPSVEPNHEHRPGWQTVVDFEPEANTGRAPGVIISAGNYWKEQRRFLLRNLRDFGFGKTSMEETLQDEVQKLIASWKEKVGQPVDLNSTTNVSILNALWAILAGEKLELDNPKLLELLGLFDQMLRETEGPTSAITQVLPYKSMAKWPIFRELSGYRLGKLTFEALARFVEPYIDEHKRTLDPDNVRDFMDLMLVEILNTTDTKSSFHGQVGHYALVNNIMDLFIAGMETTSSSLLWTMLYMIHHPEFQQRVHQEIDEVVGKNRPPSLDDRPCMHFVNAVLHESFRVTAFVPLSVPHYATSDVDIGPYTIPKGATVFASLYHVMHDETHFKDPAKFNPDRFIDTSTGKFVSHERVIPFSVGKRYCLGQSLAEKEFFLFFTGIMQQFTLKEPPGYTVPKYGPDDTLCKGILRNTPNYKVVLTNRML